MPCSRALRSSRSVCSFGIGSASLSRSSLTVAKTGAACANSGNTTSRTGRNGALPATADSIIASIRSVFWRIGEPIERIGEVGLAGGRGVADDLAHRFVSPASIFPVPRRSVVTRSPSS